MASEVTDDSKSIFETPPLYSTISTSAPADSASTVLTCISDIVSAPDFTPFFVTPTVDACSTVLSAAEFSDLLQTPNIEGHTALFWAIVNDRREAFTALFKFTPELSSVCSSDLRLACMITNDQALFAQLNLGSTNSKDGPLRRSLGCLPDEVQVQSGEGLRENQFVARFWIKKFQKRMHITQDMSVEFVAGGRIWSLRIATMPDGKLRVGFRLSQPSSPAHPACVIVMADHEKYNCMNSRHSKRSYMLVPCGFKINKECNVDNDKDVCVEYFWQMDGDWVMDNHNHVDSDGTLHVKLEITLN